MMKCRRKEAKRLSELLEDDHDICVLLAFLRERVPGHIDLDALEAFYEIATSQSQALRAESHELGTWLYAQKTKQFARMLQTLDRVTRNV